MVAPKRCQSERGFPNLPGAEEDNSGLVRKRGLHKLTSLAHIHTLQLLHHVDDLQG